MVTALSGAQAAGPWIRVLASKQFLRSWAAAAVLGIFSCLSGVGSVAADGPPVIANPVRVSIPALGVQAKVQDVGLADDGSMGVPVGFDDVAWYELGVEPGQAGYAAFTGHISSVVAPGVFYNIDGLTVGNTVHVFGDDGSELVFTVEEVDIYRAETVPLDRIFAPASQAGVVLITCGGDWDPVAHLFANRIVVYATLASG